MEDEKVETTLEEDRRHHQKTIEEFKQGKFLAFFFIEPVTSLQKSIQVTFDKVDPFNNPVNVTRGDSTVAYLTVQVNHRRNGTVRDPHPIP